MSAHTSTAVHNVTFADHKNGWLGKGALYLAADGTVAFDVGDVQVFFNSPEDFAGWLAKLNELAANTPEIVAVQS